MFPTTAVHPSVMMAAYAQAAQQVGLPIEALLAVGNPADAAPAPTPRAPATTMPVAPPTIAPATIEVAPMVHPSHQLQQHSPLRPTATYVGYVEELKDALHIFEATHRGILPRTTRRLTSDEKSKAVYHGAIHVFVEGEAGIKRWTDKLHWSASRIAGQFLVYREIQPLGGPLATVAAQHELQPPTPPKTPPADLTMMGPPSSTTARSSAAAAAVTASATTSSAAGNSEELASESSLKPDTPMARKAGYSIKGDGLVKRTLSLVYRGITHHLVSYYDSRFLDSLPRPSNDPSLRDLDVDTNVTPLLKKAANAAAAAAAAGGGASKLTANRKRHDHEDDGVETAADAAGEQPTARKRARGAAGSSRSRKAAADRRASATTAAAPPAPAPPMQEQQQEQRQQHFASSSPTMEDMQDANSNAYSISQSIFARNSDVDPAGMHGPSFTMADADSAQATVAATLPPPPVATWVYGQGMPNGAMHHHQQEWSACQMAPPPPPPPPPPMPPLVAAAAAAAAAIAAGVTSSPEWADASPSPVWVSDFVATSPMPDFSAASPMMADEFWSPAAASPAMSFIDDGGSAAMTSSAAPAWSFAPLMPVTMPGMAGMPQVSVPTEWTPSVAAMAAMSPYMGDSPMLTGNGTFPSSSPLLPMMDDLGLDSPLLSDMMFPPTTVIAMPLHLAGGDSMAGVGNSSHGSGSTDAMARSVVDNLFGDAAVDPRSDGSSSSMQFQHQHQQHQQHPPMYSGGSYSQMYSYQPPSHSPVSGLGLGGGGGSGSPESASRLPSAPLFPSDMSQNPSPTMPQYQQQHHVPSPMFPTESQYLDLSRPATADSFGSRSSPVVPSSLTATGGGSKFDVSMWLNGVRSPSIDPAPPSSLVQHSESP